VKIFTKSRYNALKHLMDQLEERILQNDQLKKRFKAFAALR